MKKLTRLGWDGLVRTGLLLVLLCIGNQAEANTAFGTNAIVATGHPLATQAGLDVLAHGGNAIDAAVAIGLTLGVVDGHNSGIGGGCLMLVRRANGQILCIDGREMAPLAANRNMFVRNGQVDPELSQLGPLAIGVPGALMAYNYAAANFGRVPLRDHLLRAASLAERGFAIDATYAQRLSESAPGLAVYPETRAIFLHRDGTVPREGETLRQADLARTYRGIAQQGVTYFYGGAFASAVAQWMGSNGGILGTTDMIAYRVLLREPVTTTYRGRTIVGFSPPSSGGVGVAETLNILENYDLAKVGANSGELIHIIAEAMKLAFADRAYWLGDSDYTTVPRTLISKPYAKQLAGRIDRAHARAVRGHSIPPGANQANNSFGRHTTHFSVADAAGNWVACTASINTSFGSKVVIPGTGVLMNNEMDDFAAQPGVPNYFGLVGAEANAVGPGKRPLSSMSPTLVLAEGRPIAALGAAGGPTIITQVVLAIINMIDFGMELDQALAQPRFHQQWRPDELRIESSVGETVLQDLRNRGQQLTAVQAIGAAQAVGRTTDGQRYIGVSEPRGAGLAEGR